MRPSANDFPSKTIEILKKRAAFICSNPSCKKMTVAPSEIDNEKILYIGRGAHIHAASENGPRYNPDLNPEEVSAIDNALFLCANCADLVDDNNGLDFKPSVLKMWKSDHEQWVRSQLNKSVNQTQTSTFHITSNGQQGGITAGIVNLNEKPRRTLDEALKTELLNAFPETNKLVKISAQMGNSEALSFANEIRQHLVDRGFEIFSVGQIMPHPPVEGIVKWDEVDGTHLVIGTQP